MTAYHSELVTAVTRFDRKQEERAAKRKGGYYNHYALAQYLMRVDAVAADIERGANVRDAVCAGFTGALRDACLRHLGMPKGDNGPDGRWTYSPITLARKA
jgi:predicted membrane-bound mannosyltransferase